MTFPEALDEYGRDSIAIAEAMGVSEAIAYNMMAREVEKRRPIQERRDRNLILRDNLRAIREQRAVAR